MLFMLSCSFVVIVVAVFIVCRPSDSDSDNEAGDPEKKKLQEKLAGKSVYATPFSRQDSAKNRLCYTDEILFYAADLFLCHFCLF